MLTEREKYIYHVTTTTGCATKNLRSQLDIKMIENLKDCIKEMIHGKPYQLSPKGYFCRVGVHNSHAIEFVVYKENSDFVRIVVCNHSRKKHRAWQSVGGVGEPPNLPFCGTQYLNVTTEDTDTLSLFTSFEHHIAWAWLDLRKEGKND